MVVRLLGAAASAFLLHAHVGGRVLAGVLPRGLGLRSCLGGDASAEPRLFGVGARWCCGRPAILGDDAGFAWLPAKRELGPPPTSLLAPSLHHFLHLLSMSIHFAQAGHYVASFHF